MKIALLPSVKPSIFLFYLRIANHSPLHKITFRENIPKTILSTFQVALGKSAPAVGENGRPDKGFQSLFVRARSEPNPVDDLALCSPGEPVIPLGGLVEVAKTPETKWWCLAAHSEYVIFDEDQIALRYLIRFS